MARTKTRAKKPIYVRLIHFFTLKRRIFSAIFQTRFTFLHENCRTIYRFLYMFHRQNFIPFISFSGISNIRCVRTLDAYTYTKFTQWTIFDLNQFNKLFHTVTYIWDHRRYTVSIDENEGY